MRIIRILPYVMNVFQVSLNFDSAKEILKIWCQIYILMKQMIILSKIHATMKTYVPPFFNHFSLSLNRKNVWLWESWGRNYRSCSQIFLKIGALKNFTNFTTEHLCWHHFLIKFLINFIKKRLQHNCFPVNWAKFLRRSFLQNTSSG